MGRLLRPIAALLLALFARPDPASAPPSPRPEGDAEWYAPRAEDFRPAYDRDSANRERQPWEQYWRWVGSFYQGNYFAKGWSERARWAVESVRLEREQRRLRAELNALGRDICAEWAKEFDGRKVTSADLLTWGKMLEKARADDDGTGAELRRAIGEIRKDHRRRLSGAASSR